MDYKKYLDMTHDSDYLDLYNYYATETIYDVLNIARQENPHSAYIRWLLDSNSDHGLRDIPFRKFMETICLAKEKLYGTDNDYVKDNLWKNDSKNLLAEDNSNILEEIKYGRYKVEEIHIANEVVLSKQRRADIVGIVTLKFQNKINGKDNINLIMLIENKISSIERKNQTTDYVSELNSAEKINNVIQKVCSSDVHDIDFSDCYKLFIFLNPYSNEDIKNALEKKDLEKKAGKQVGKKNGKLNNALAESPEYITLTYQYLLTGVLEPLLSFADNEIIKNRLSEYIRCLGQAKIEQDDQKDKKNKADTYLIMAVSQREKDKALKLLEKHSSVVAEVINSFAKGETIINESDCKFWVSIINLYMLMIKQIKAIDIKGFDVEELERNLHETIKSNSLQIREYKYNSQLYSTRSEYNAGRLCRDLIAEYAQMQSNRDVKQELNKLRKGIQNEIKLNWLREGIIFSDEVKNLVSIPAYWNKDFDESTLNGTGTSGCRYDTKCFEEFLHAFFSYGSQLGKQKVYLKKDDYKGNEKDDYAIVLPDDSRAYVAKFWTDSSLRKLLDLLDKESEEKFSDKVTFL